MTTDPSDDLVSFLRSNVDDSNISVPFSTSDDIDHADYDGPNDYPQIAVVSNDPVVPGGGETGWTGMDPGGGGPIQDRVETMLVDCWGGPEDRDVYQNNGTHPDKVAAELRAEVVRACNAAAAGGAPSAYEWIAATPQGDADDTERDRTHYREQALCRLKHTETY